MFDDLGRSCGSWSEAEISHSPVWKKTFGTMACCRLVPRHVYRDNIYICGLTRGRAWGFPH